jgi:hypothetical protein
MSGVYHVLTPNGEHLLFPSKARTPDYEVLREHVGGYLERIQIKFEGRVRYAYVDEEGLIKGLPTNYQVMRILAGHFAGYRAPIVGNAVVWIPEPRSKKNV